MTARLPAFLRGIRMRLTLWYLAVLTGLLVLFSVGVYTYLTASISSQISGLEASFHRTLVYGAATDAKKAEARVIQSNSLLGTISELYVPKVYAGPLKLCPGTRGEQQRCPVGQVLSIEAALVSGRQECKQSAGYQLSCTWLVRSPTTHLVVGAVNLQASLAGAYHARDQLGTRLILGVPIGLLVALLGGWVLASRALSPVEQLRRMADSITGTDLSRRIGLQRSDELGKLGQTFDGMIERLETAFREQRQLTADVSHELRTPLSVIHAQATLALKRTRTAEEYGTVLRSIEEEAEHMSKIVEDLLLLARAEAGQEVIQRDLIRLDSIARWAADHVRPAADAKGVTVALDVSPVMIDADEDRIRQLCRNLADNAVKYTDQGGVVALRVRQEDSAILEVADTGEGIDADSLPHIFQRFYRTDQARSRSEGGSGLGLAITRWIAEAHGGSIAVTSQRGLGTTFTVRIPSVSEELSPVQSSTDESGASIGDSVGYASEVSSPV